MNLQEKKLNEFINGEKEIFANYKTNINWDDEFWDVSDWLFHRGKDTKIIFVTLFRPVKNGPKDIITPPQQALPHPYIDFVKAVGVYLHRTKGVGYMAIRNYVNECRRLHLIMYQRKETSPSDLTRWHFERILEYFNEINYKNIYDAAANLQVIAEVIDKKFLTPLPLDFKHGLNPTNRFHDYKSTLEITDEDKRRDEEKLPSYEAMQAYALCTNNPINDNEEILLRTIDLLIAMGQRVNEVALLPVDCWVEDEVRDSKGNIETDAYGNPIIRVGIRYYAEKQFQSRIHWLADQDVPFAKRAIDRLTVLTQEARLIAKWQEQNPGRIWDLDPKKTIDDDSLMKYLGFANAYNLQLYLTKRNGIQPKFIDHNYKRPYYFSQGYYKRYLKRYHYQVSEIEALLLPQLNDHIAFKEKVDGKWKTILKTSDVLSIRFDGAFKFKERGANIFKVFVGRTQVTDINIALGAISRSESIFERRGLTEADGSKIELTSHKPRHWRNTIYELAGMSNVNQALAMGRQRLDQNPAYQHTTLKELTQSHQDFLTFNSAADKVTFLHDGIRNKTILGNITNTYHYLKNKSIDKAEIFLKTHALALHITPFGGCTHDFSQAPCPKHLQCWNGCSHLHRTFAPGETERIREQLDLSIKALNEMKQNSEDYGSDVWIKDLSNKIENLENGLKIEPKASPAQVFPDGKPVTVAIHLKGGSSVSES